MSKSTALVPSGEIVTPLSLLDLCRICGSPADWVIELVEEGILEPEGASQTVWRFESTCITRVRKVQRLQTDLHLNIAGVALVLSLVEENAGLKRRLQLLENDPRYAIWMPDLGDGPED
ncbi:chaperone modulator CbpM [Lentibacter sp. XHP0401]|uniref:chaperone modulator CbpM n=1 Tax=Lentibacter sp. XHP0401 TaxID=2984334 RepID=UPI0021E7126B|nr:chaperone modulator CbpM [Lentibacter sp. XHP0401]MCV2891896.1 chaperone modulator CbpM [Lentibacter sp. XHP0401]